MSHPSSASSRSPIAPAPPCSPSAPGSSIGSLASAATAAAWLRWLHIPLALAGLYWVEPGLWPRYLLVTGVLALTWPFCIRLTEDADVHMYMPVMWTSAAAAYVLGPAILPVFWIGAILGFSLIVILDSTGLIPAVGIAAESARRWRGEPFVHETVAAGDVRHTLNMAEHAVRVAGIAGCRAAALPLLPTILLTEVAVVVWRNVLPVPGSLAPSRTWTRVAASLGPDMPLATLLLHVVMVCFLLLATGAGGLPGFTAASLSTLSLHVILKRLNDTRVESERRREELVAMADELDRRRRLAVIGQTAATVFHQVGRHHGAIGMYAHLLGRGVADPDLVRAHAARIRTSVAEANRVVEELLRFGQDRSLNLYPHALADVIAECVADCTPRAAARGIELLALPSPDVTVSLDKHKVKQAVGNLLDNAIEASASGMRVEIEAQADQAGVRITVRDHGAGVAPGIRPRLFAPFATTKPDGNGLGLALARELIQAHGGALDWHPAQPGTAFVVALPAQAPDDPGR